MANDVNLSAMPPLTIIDKNNVAVMQYKTKISNLNPLLMELNKINAITNDGYSVSKFSRVLENVVIENFDYACRKYLYC